MMIPAEDKEVNGYANNVENIFSHPRASRTGRFKYWEAAPAPTITATRKQKIQTRILPHSDCRKARRTQRAQTRATKLGMNTSSEDQGAASPKGLAHHDTSTGMIGRDRVTSQSAMNVTPPRQGYMMLFLQISCYLERQSGEGGTPAVIEPLVLTYYFGRATLTPDGTKAVVQNITCDVHTGGNESMSAHTPLESGPRVNRGVLLPAWSRTSGITGRRPQTPVEENGAETDRADNIISEASTIPIFGALGGFIPRKETGRTILSRR